MHKVLNPYMAGPPLHEDRNFFGRQRLLVEVESDIGNKNINAVVLFGQRRVGKTSLLRKLERSLDNERFLPVYFDLQDYAETPLGEVLAELADRIAMEADLEMPDIDEIDNQGNFFQRRFLPKVQATLGEGNRLVLLLDEFDVLEQAQEEKMPDNIASKSFFPFLRRLLNENVPVTFVFVIGRQADDLTTDFEATFKGATTREVWILGKREDAVALIRQAEENDSLRFTEDAVDRILDLTSQHPYFTQLLCQRIWEGAYAEGNEPSEIPVITAEDVEAAVPNALEAGDTAITWLWNGLTLPEKIYAAAFAQADEEIDSTISEDHVMQVITEYAARLRTSEVEQASQFLVKRRVLQPSDQPGKYHFAVEIFRRWVRQRQRLQDIKDELDKVNSIANNLYQTGREFFDNRQWLEAARYYQDALDRYPEHFRARLELGESLLNMGRVDEAIDHLEKAYELDKTETRYTLARALILKAQQEVEVDNEDGALKAIERTLIISPNEREAQQLKETIWLRRADEANKSAAAAERRKNLIEAQRELETAIHAYEQAGATEQADELRPSLQIIAWQNEAHASQKNGDWKEAVAAYQLLLQTYPDHKQQAEWQQALDDAVGKAGLFNFYQRGLEYLNAQNWVEAQREFSRIVTQEPNYTQNTLSASRLLMLAQLEQAAAEHYEAHRWQKGIEAYQNLLSLFRAEQPERVKIWDQMYAECQKGAELAQLFDQGHRNLENGHLTEARTQFQELLSRDENYMHNGRQTSDLLRETEEKIRIRSTLEADGNWEAAQVEYHRLYDQAQYEEEKIAWQTEIDRCLKELEIAQLFAASKEFLNQEEWTNAQQALAKVVAYRPDYWHKGDTASALLDQAVSQKRIDLEQRFQQGLTYMEAEDWANAQRAFADIVNQQPDFKSGEQEAAKLLQFAVTRQDSTPVKRSTKSSLLLVGAGVILAIFAIIFIMVLLNQSGQGDTVAQMMLGYETSTPEKITPTAIVITVTGEAREPIVVTATPGGIPIPAVETRITSTVIITDYVPGAIAIELIEADNEPFVQPSTPLYNNLDSISEVSVAPNGNRGTGALTYSPEGELMAVASGKQVAIFGLQDPPLLWDLRRVLLMENNVTEVEFVQDPVDTDNLILAIGMGDGSIELRDVHQVSDTFEERLQLQGLGHINSVNQVTFSPSGWVLASGGEDGHIMLWCTLNGVREENIDKYTTNEEISEDLGPVSAVAFQPLPQDQDMELLVSASGEAGLIKVWQVVVSRSGGENICQSPDPTGEPQSGTSNEWFHDKRVTDMKFSPDGKILATAADGEIKLWLFDNRFDESPSPIHAPISIPVEQTGIDAPIERVNSISFLSGATGPYILAAGTENGDIYVWQFSQTSSPELLQTTNNNDDEVNMVAFSPDGLLLATSLDKQGVRLHHANIQSLTGKGNQETAVAIIVDGDQSVLAIALDNGQVKLDPLTEGASAPAFMNESDAYTGQPIKDIQFINHENCDLALAVLGETVLTVWVLDAESNQFGTPQSISLPETSDDEINPFHFDFVCHEQDLYLLGGRLKSNIIVQQIASGTEPKNYNLQVDDSPNTSISTNEEITHLTAVSNNGKLLLLAGFNDYSPRLWSFEPLSVDGAILIGSSLLSTDGQTVVEATFSPNGESILAVTNLGQLYLWVFDGEGFNEEHRINLGESFAVDDDVLRVLWLLDDQSFLLGKGNDNELKLWNSWDSIEPVRILGTIQISDIVIDPSGLVMVTLSENQGIQFWGIPAP